MENTTQDKQCKHTSIEAQEPAQLTEHAWIINMTCKSCGLKRSIGCNSVRLKQLGYSFENDNSQKSSKLF